jgi:hypothetical protein
MKEFEPLPYQYDERDLIACAKDHPSLARAFIRFAQAELIEKTTVLAILWGVGYGIVNLLWRLLWWLLVLAY